jgi:hypothetical protein
MEQYQVIYTQVIGASCFWGEEGVWDLNSVLPFARQSLYYLSHSTSPFFALGVFEVGSCKLFALAGFKLQSS